MWLYGLQGPWVLQNPDGTIPSSKMMDGLYVKGKLNKVAYCLSWYYENDTSADVHEPHKYIHADARMDPEGDDLPEVKFCELVEHIIELCMIHASEHRQSQCIQEHIEDHNLEAQIINKIAVQEQIREPPNDRMMLGDSLFRWSSNTKPTNLEDNKFLQAVQEGYSDDKLFILAYLREAQGLQEFLCEQRTCIHHQPLRRSGGMYTTGSWTHHHIDWPSAQYAGSLWWSGYHRVPLKMVLVAMNGQGLIFQTVVRHDQKY